MSERKIIQVEDKVPFKLLLPLSIQHMFAMFGASVLVPFIFGINPAIVLFMNGVGLVKWVIPMPWEDSWQSVSAAVFFLLLFINVEQNGLTWFCRLQLWDRSLL